MADSGRWKVQLELAPAEIAFVYRQGLARGAEVCRRGTHEWRPLVTTPELRSALARSPSLAEMIQVAPPAGSALTLSQTLAISDPALAALFLARRSQLPKGAPPPPPAISKSAPPPPLVPKSAAPPVLTTQVVPEITRPAPLVRGDSIPDWEDTPLLPVRVAPQFAPSLAPQLMDHGRVVHARPIELSVVAAVAVALTLAITALTLRAEAPKLNALYSASRPAAPRATPPVARSSDTRAPGPAAIPVVYWRDLPIEGGRTARASASSVRASGALGPASAQAGSGPDRASLARALGGAAAAAQSCGTGPVSATVVVTFAPSGVARNIHFSSAPPLALRSCVLNAVARTHLAPFQGEPVTVSKTFRW